MVCRSNGALHTLGRRPENGLRSQENDTAPAVFAVGRHSCPVGSSALLLLVRWRLFGLQRAYNVAEAYDHQNGEQRVCEVVQHLCPQSPAASILPTTQVRCQYTKWRTGEAQLPKPISPSSNNCAKSGSATAIPDAVKEALQAGVPWPSSLSKNRSCCHDRSSLLRVDEHRIATWSVIAVVAS